MSLLVIGLTQHELLHLQEAHASCDTLETKHDIHLCHLQKNFNSHLFLSIHCHKNLLKARQHTLNNLLSTDFMDFRPNYVPPTGWLEWREAVRGACQDAKVAIKACITVEELIALPSVDWPKDPNWVAPTVSEVAEV